MTETVRLPQALTQIKNGLMTFDHEYMKSGKYKAMFTLSNIISNLVLKKQVVVMKRITGLSVEAKIRGRQETGGYGSRKDRYPTGTSIDFIMRTTEGDVEKYLIEINGQPFKETTLDKMSFSSQEVRAETSRSLCGNLLCCLVLSVSFGRSGLISGHDHYVNCF